MSNSTMKRTCIKCHAEKPLTDFYKHPSGKDGYNNVCKACYKTQQYERRQRTGVNSKSKEIPQIESESEVMALLRGKGIYAAPGKSSEWKYTDLVCWGCVRLEVKTSHQYDDGTFTFNFTPKQRKQMIWADLILLVCKGKKETTYHLFPANHSVFFMNGRMKHGIEYDPYQTNRKNGHGTRLTLALMNQYKSAWYLIEEKRLEIQKRLLGETVITETFKQPQLWDLTA